MAVDPLLARSRAVWAGLAGVPVTFPGAGATEVVASAGSLLCPPGWSGIVVLGGAGIATVPAESLVGVVRRALAGLGVATATDADRLRAALPVTDVRGPASLAYLDEADFRPVAGPVVVERLPPGHRDLAVLLASVDADEAEECGLEEITSNAFVVRSGHTVMAAAGYRRWPGSAANLSVLTSQERRGQGLARLVAAAAVRDALANRLLPQWRARFDPSRRVAHALGFRRLGVQLSVRIAT